MMATYKIDGIAGIDAEMSEKLKEAGVDPDLIRRSVGIEDVEDILDDIKQALDKI